LNIRVRPFHGLSGAFFRSGNLCTGKVYGLLICLK
jgi:hypothetical protein